jgi:broad specificity phosphatase PhoE
LNRIHGYIPSKTVSLLMGHNILPRKIYFTLAGESKNNVEKRIGGDSDLSELGESYAKKLSEFICELPENEKIVVFTSTLKRSLNTAKHLKNKIIQWKAMDDLDSGVCDGMKYAEIKESMPEIYKKRIENKFQYRYPRGESYIDLIHRLEPIIIELEQSLCPILIITHAPIMRVLYSYFIGKKPKECVNTILPFQCVIQITPGYYSNQELRFDLSK